MRRREEAWFSWKNHQKAKNFGSKAVGFGAKAIRFGVFPTGFGVFPILFGVSTTNFVVFPIHLGVFPVGMEAIFVLACLRGCPAHGHRQAFSAWRRLARIVPMEFRCSTVLLFAAQ